jgi:hypothetical protein
MSPFAMVLFSEFLPPVAAVLRCSTSVRVKVKGELPSEKPWIAEGDQDDQPKMKWLVQGVTAAGVITAEYQDNGHFCPAIISPLCTVGGQQGKFIICDASNQKLAMIDFEVQ